MAGGKEDKLKNKATVMAPLCMVVKHSRQTDIRITGHGNEVLRQVHCQSRKDEDEVIGHERRVDVRSWGEFKGAKLQWREVAALPG